MEAAGSHIDARVGGRGEELQESGRFSGFLRPTPPRRQGRGKVPRH